MDVITHKEQLRDHINILKSQGKSVAFIPTMGALHDGHLSLVRQGLEHADITVTSIFVNQAQFAPHEDFDQYPKDEQSDLDKLKISGNHIAYLPSQSAMYPEGFSTSIDVGPIGQQLEGIYRPHFFNGVALVVLKLFHQVSPNIALFGEKDFQQFTIIKQLCQSLDLPISIISSPTIRTSSGLAMSSRNRYLNEQETTIASRLYQTLTDVRDKLINHSNPSVEPILQWGTDQLLTYGFNQVDYLSLCDATTLKVCHRNNPDQSTRLFAATRLGNVRLIDNINLDMDFAL